MSGLRGARRVDGRGRPAGFAAHANHRLTRDTTMRIILLGAPGSGKGTQARKLVDAYKVPQISTGDILRAAVSEGSEAGRRAEQIMKEGGLVPDDLVIELVSQRVLKSDTRRGFILDGFPRNIPQAQELDTRLGWVSRPIQIAINFEVDRDSLTQRLTGRRTCENCGAIYNVYLNPPATRGRCDACGSTALAQRPDDNADTVEARLKVYHEETELLVQYYRAQHKLRTLNANGDTDEIFARLCEMIDREIRPLENKVVSIHGTVEGNTTHTQIVGGKVVREVAGNDVRTTRVQPRQLPEASQPAASGAKAKAARKSGAQSGKSGPGTAAKRKTVAGGKSASKADKTGVDAAADATLGRKTATPATVVKKSAGSAKTSGKKTASTKKVPAEKKTARRKAAGRPASTTGKAVKKTTKKKTVKKASAAKKSSTSKKAPAVRKKTAVVAKSAAVKKKSATRKVSVKKKPAKKASSKKTSSKKASARKAPVRKVAAKKAAARKSTARKTVARKKTTVSKAARKSAVKKKAPVRKKAPVGKKIPNAKKTANRRKSAGKAARRR